MKTQILHSVLFAAISYSAFAQNDENAKKAEAYYNQGRRAESAGDPGKALQSYRAALQLNPNHANARYRLGEVKANSEDIKLGAVRTKIEEVTIPTYQIDGATIHEALEVLSLAMEKQSEGKITANFVVQDPKNSLESSKLSLQLKNVPVKAILKYITTQTNTQIRYDEYAVVISAK